MLKLTDVCYRYKKGNRDVLKSVTCEFVGGKVQAIVGPSGSGKTTLLSILAGLDSPKSGVAVLGDTEFTSIDPDKYRRENVSIIFQSFQLFPLLTAIENVCYPMQLNGTDKKDAIEKASQLLISVGITDELHKRYPANLSGGEQQRVAIARALASGAKIILADEPTGNLDKENGEAVVQILRDLAHEQDYCIIIVTHNLEIAESADVIFRMSDGVLSG